MAHFVRNFFQGKISLLMIIQHQGQRVLYPGQPRVCVPVRPFFFRKQVGCMVGGNYISRLSSRASQSACLFDFSLMAGLHLIR
jgi:hypothetical protein